MRIKILLAATVAVAFIISACQRNLVALDYTNAKNEVQPLGNLVFRFNKTLIADSLLNQWDSTEYISFEPKIPGRFRWEGPDQLVFSPAKPLAPATTYKAKIKDNVLRYSNYDRVEAADKIQFHTAPLSLEDAFVTWIVKEGEIRGAIPQIRLAFNYAVNPETLKDKVKIEVEGASAAFSLQTLSASNEIHIQLPGYKAEDKNAAAKLIIEKGIKPEGGNNTTGESMQSALTIPSPYILQINEVQSEHDGISGTVRISTSQQLSTENINAYVQFNPAVNYTVEYTDFGAVLHSDKFDVENSYSLQIRKGLRGKIGGVLKEDYQNSIAFGELESDVKFANSKAIYLSKSGSGNVEVRITNTPKVKLVISKIYENNLLMAQRYGYYPKENDGARFASLEGEDEYDNYDESMAGDVVYAKTIDTRSLPKSGNGRLLNLGDFEDRLPDAKGIYHVMVRSEKDYWVRDSRFISFSDIGLIAKQGKDKIVVFANSIKTANTLNGVTINVYGSNNQLLGTGATNTDGVAEVAITRKDIGGFRPAMVVAKTADDFTYLPFSNTRVNTSRFDVGGKRNNATGLDAFIYAERDIYRPGEKMNFAVLVRDLNWKSPGELPIKMKMLLPNGKELKTFRKSLNEGGATDGSIDISAAAITGSYLLEVYSSNDVLLASENFMVEEFVPDRIKVAARLNKQVLRPSDVVQLQINAVNFFGPPAALRNYEAEVQLKPKTFRAKGFNDYDFNLANGERSFEKTIKEGKTDEGGNAMETYEVPSLYKNTGLLQANFYTTVFDETGRPVSRLTNAEVYTQDVFHGIKDDGFYYYTLNRPVQFLLVSLNKDGAPITATAKVQVIKHEYKTVLVKNGGYFRYESQQQDKLMAEGTIAVGNATPYHYTPRSPGDYEIRVFRPDANTYISKRFYSYGSWGADATSFEVNAEGHVDIEMDKEAYKTGEMAKVLFKTPFSGRMLVTTERDGLISHQYINVEKRTATLDLKLSAEHVPNIYITATLIKPHLMADIPLTVAHGFQNVKVEESGRKMSVAIVAPTTSRSSKKQAIKVKAAPGSFVSLAAVDQGVLQITDFKTPDPYSYYYQKKALEVTAFDMYPLLFPELRNRLSSTGGDGESDMQKRVNPMQAKRFKIFSYWSGIRKTDGSGEATFELDIPQFNGQVRLMAVAFKDEKFGAADASLTVADPIVISSALPRFFSPGDTALVPVTISNTTAATTTGQAAIAAAGPWKIIGTPIQNISVAPNSETKVVFQLASGQAVGVGKIDIQVKTMGETFRQSTEVAVRPPSTLQKLTGSGAVAGGSTEKLNIPEHDFFPGSVNYELVVSRSPVAEIADQLKYLVQYPYGCTEQTISAAFPQLYYGDMADMMQAGKNNKQQAVTNIHEAIRKIKMRQLYNGAVTLWDGGGHEDWWTTTYAAHFLLEARKAGYDVDASLLQTLLGYLSHRLKTKETISYYYNRDQQRKIAPKEVPYSLYVLAAANQAQVAAMNYYKANPQLLALDGRYLLSAAYAMAGDKKAFVNFLPSSFSGEASVQQTGGSFYSEARDEAIALNALLDADPGHAQVPAMAKHVAVRLKKEKYLNTQERSFSFLALGKLAKAAAKSNVTADIRIDGKTVARIDGNNWKGDKSILASRNIELVTKGKGRLYYSWEVSGISTSGSYVEVDNYLKVRRQLFDRMGRPVTGNTFRQNEIIIVKLTLEKAYSNNIENIVITDILPAGFEIENPRTKELPGMDWIKNASEPQALDIRDDRIHFFVNAGSQQQSYYYAVRAVSLGTFRQGPVSADAMYHGEMHSYHGAGVVKITSP